MTLEADFKELSSFECHNKLEIKFVEDLPEKYINDSEIFIADFIYAKPIKLILYFFNKMVLDNFSKLNKTAFFEIVLNNYVYENNDGDQMKFDTEAISLQSFVNYL